MKNENNKGIQRLVNATRFTFKGIRSAWSNEEAFRQESLVLILVIPAGLFFGETLVQKGLFICVWLLVLIIELLNSALESVVDRIGYEKHPLSGQAKDMGSAAVFIGICLSFIIWGAIICERFVF
ncbi:MAG: diacylglycerol kinase [Desulfobacula sp.]|nr:diacylglycerol kinase [Desulfobacula sp.]